MPDYATELIIIAVLILLNSVLAMAEIALISARKARLQTMSNEGNLNAALALRVTENPNLFLSVIQIGITLIDVTTGALGGATLARYLGYKLAEIPLLAPYAETISLTLVVLIITYFSLIIGELVPKRLAMQNPERISSYFARPMMVLSRILSPAVKVLSFSTETMLRLLGVRPSKDLPVTEEELQVLLDQGTEAGVFEEAETDMVTGIFRLGDRRVYSLMTPRTEITWLEINDTLDEIRQKVETCSFSRFPVCQGELDNVLGIVKTRDLLIPILSNKPLEIKNCLQPALYIPETAFASRALEIFKESTQEMLLVIDEFGGVQGLITINDILEEIVGEIELTEPQATQRQDGSWLLDGMLQIDDLKEILQLRQIPGEGKFETLGGFMMATLGRIPRASDQFELFGLIFEVMDMDGRRVDKVLVTNLPVKPPST